MVLETSIAAISNNKDFYFIYLHVNKKIVWSGKYINFIESLWKKGGKAADLCGKLKKREHINGTAMTQGINRLSGRTCISQGTMKSLYPKNI